LTRIDQADKTGYLQSRCCFFLMNIHTWPRTIYFARASCTSRTGATVADHSVRTIAHRTFVQSRFGSFARRLGVCRASEGSGRRASKGPTGGTQSQRGGAGRGESIACLDISEEASLPHCLAVRARRLQGGAKGHHVRDQPVSFLVRSTNNSSRSVVCGMDCRRRRPWKCTLMNGRDS
jgi:hypothetical protein